jgi:hypothetical protein
VIARVFAGQDGETHLAVLELPVAEGAGPGLSQQGLRDIPTTTLGITEMLEKRRSWDLHPAPRRQLVVVVRGAFEVTTTDGDRKRFRPGDCLFADDLDSKGHGFADVGDERMMTFQIGIDDAWQWPGA